MFGGLRVEFAGIEVTRFETRKAAEIFASLALNLGRARDRAGLTERFWPGEDPSLARNNLRQGLASIRRTLSDKGRGEEALLQADRLQVRLNPALSSSDADDWTRLQRAAELDPEKLGTLLSLYSGPLLPGFSDDEFYTKRIQFAEENISCRLRLAKQLSETDPDGAIEWAVSAIGFDPIREESTVTAMRLLQAAGRPAEAVRHYQNLVHHLSTELHMNPSDEVRKFAQEMVSSLPRITSRRVEPAEMTRTFETNIALPLTPLFGRTDELRELVAFAAPDVANSGAPRLGTLTGLGGIGKTRLAQEVASRVVADYNGAVWFVPLADVRHSSGLPLRLLEAIGIQPGWEDEVTQAVRRLSGYPALIIFDNLEQILGGATDTLGHLLERLPLLKCLVTSRERLNVGFDREFPIGALPEPSDGDTLEELEDQPTVQLFLDRARQAGAQLTLTSETAPAIAAICKKLEGIPLALVIAGSTAKGVDSGRDTNRIEPST